MVRAAVFHEVGQDKLDLRDDMEVVGPGPGQVRVRIRATGVCHSDLSAVNGTIPQPPPCVLGHENQIEVQQHGSADTHRETLHRCHIGFTSPCQRIQEPDRGHVLAPYDAGCDCGKVSQIVASGECITFGVEQYRANPAVGLGVLQCLEYPAEQRLEHLVLWVPLHVTLKRPP